MIFGERKATEGTAKAALSDAGRGAELGEAHGAGAALSAGAAGKRFRESLRNANINYRNGWFFVTVQVAKNKSIFGAIVGERVVLNKLGQAVEAKWRELPSRYPELELFDFVVMPNHFHALLRVHYCETNREHQLGFLMGRFKGATARLYGQLREAGEIEDIGPYLWQLDYWDKLVTSEEQFAAYQKYIRENPANWSRDRWGAVTSYSFGNLELLNRPRIAFVASQGYYASELKPRKIWPKGVGVSGRALLLSPQPPLSRLNKKVATWCNEYVLRHAGEIWAGDLKPGGMLVAMLRGLARAA